MNLHQTIASVVEREIRSGKFTNAEKGGVNYPEVTAQVSLIFPRKSVEKVIDRIKQGHS